jgi:hypothetical protein
MEKDLYKQAIVDAKAIRANAIANAKATLQESMEPKIQEMMRMKLAEDLEEEQELEEEFQDMEEGSYGNDNPIDESTLDEILDELNSLEEENAKNELEEGVADLEEDESSIFEDEDEGEDDEEGGEGDDIEIEDQPEEGGGLDGIELDTTIGELIAAYKAAQGEEVEGAEDMAIDDMEMEPGAEGDEEMEETLSLDEVLAQLEAEEMQEANELEEEEELEEKKKKGEEKEENLEEKVEDLEEELEEAQDAIITLNETLKELNLLNAKLLFANKILRAKNLNESEKSRVIKAFDRTRTVKETKNTYATLMESLSKKPMAKAQLKESIGFASKPSGMPTKQANPIVESDGFISRWQKIAGIK